jgi:WD40 repeat protein
MSQLGKFKAFISYSHKDKKIARWLHRRLDGYVAPIERKEPRRKPWRVFIDDFELPTGSLKDSIRNALGESDHLIVVCTPSSARSDYVDEEIRLFADAKGGQRVLAVIADGVPHNAERECFPKAIKQLVDTSTENRSPVEPVAADLQVFSRRQVRFKVLAGLLGISYGDLIDREHRRRVRRIAWAGSLAVTVFCAIAGLSAFSVINAREAARSRGESFVQQGQRAIAANDLIEARRSFSMALSESDSLLARQGLTRVISSPAEPLFEWQAPVDKSGAAANLMSVAFLDDQHLVAVGTTGAIHMIDTERRSVVWTKDLGAEISAVAVSLNRDVAIGLAAGAIVWLNAQDGAEKSRTTMSSGVISLRYDATGTSLAVGLRGGLVVLSSDGEPQLDMQSSHSGEVQGLAFNHSGDFIYWGGSSPYLWACPLTGQCQMLTRVEEWIYAVDGSHDTRFTAFTAGPEIAFFDHAMQQMRSLAAYGGHVFAMRFDPNGRLLLAGDSNGQLLIYDVRSQKLLFSTRAHKGGINGVAFAPNGELAVSVASDGIVKIWRVAVSGEIVPASSFTPAGVMLTPTQRNRITDLRVLEENLVAAMTASGDQQLLTIHPAGPKPEMDPAKARDKYAVSLDLARSTAFRMFSLPPSSAWLFGEEPGPLKDAVQFSAEASETEAMSRDARLLALADSEGSIEVFDRQTKKTAKFGVGAQPASMTFQPATELLVAGLKNGRVVGVNRETGGTVFDGKCGDGDVDFVVANFRAGNVIAASMEGAICVIKPEGSVEAEIELGPIETIALSPQESMLAVGGPDGQIVLLDVADLKEIARFDGHRGPVHAVHFTLDGEELVSGGADETMRVWPAAEAHRIMTLPLADVRAKYPVSLSAK